MSTCDRPDCENPVLVHLVVIYESDGSEQKLDLCAAHSQEALDMLREWAEGVAL